MSILEEHIKEQAAEKEMTTKEWLEKRIKEIPHCRVATHIGKFTHPDTKVSYFYADSRETQIGYIMTDMVKYPIDIGVNARYLPTAKLLLLELEDGITVLDHIIAEDVDVKAVIEQLGGNYKLLCDNVNEIRYFPIKHSDWRLKQVYFPVATGEYHLLTVLPASSILTELHKRIRKLNEQKFNFRNEKSEDYGKSYLEVLNTTVIGFGGTKPQNISILNNENGGKAILLESLPPNMVVRAIRLPKRNFWNESIPYRQYIDLFYRLHKFFVRERNNQQVREAIRKAVDALVDIVICMRYQILQEPKGWSDRESYKHLAHHQKVWLDQKYDCEADKEAVVQKLSGEFSRWLIQGYARIIKEHVPLGDDEYNFFAERMEVALTEEVRNRL